MLSPTAFSHSTTLPVCISAEADGIFTSNRISVSPWLDESSRSLRRGRQRSAEHAVGGERTHLVGAVAAELGEHLLGVLAEVRAALHLRRESAEAERAGHLAHIAEHRV